jgi:hypothetical protein
LATLAAPATPVRFVPVHGSGYSQADIDRFGPVIYQLAIELGGLDPGRFYDWMIAHPDDERTKLLWSYFPKKEKDSIRLHRISVLQDQFRAVALVFKTSEGEEVVIRALHYVSVRREVTPEEAAVAGHEETEADPGVSRQPKYRRAGIYMPITEVAKDPDYEEQVITQLERELAGLTRRLARYRLVFPSFRQKYRRVYNALRDQFGDA